MQKLSRNELLLIANLLELASVQIKECADIPEKYFNTWSIDDKRKLEKDFAEINPDLQEILEEFETDFEQDRPFMFGDTTAMEFFSKKIRNFYE